MKLPRAKPSKKGVPVDQRKKESSADEMKGVVRADRLLDELEEWYFGFAKTVENAKLKVPSLREAWENVKESVENLTNPADILATVFLDTVKWKQLMQRMKKLILPQDSARKPVKFAEPVFGRSRARKRDPDNPEGRG